MIYYKDKDGDVHAIESRDFESFLPEGCIEISAEEAKAIAIPEKSQQDLQDEAFMSIRRALQAEIDKRAQTAGFSNGNAALLYAGFANAFQSWAKAFSAWEASVWVAAGAYRDQVLAGTKPMLTPEEAVAMMPAYPS